MDPIVAPVVEPTEPASPAPSTLENLEQNVATELTGASAAPDGSAAPVDPNAASGEPAEAPPAEADGKSQRIQQENAQLRATVRKFGVDPDSDVMDQLNSGLLTVADIVKPREPVEPPAPTQTLQQKIDNLKTANLTGTDGAVDAKAFLDDRSQLIEVLDAVVQDNTQLRQAREGDQQTIRAQQTASAAASVFDTDVNVTLPDDVMSVAKELFLGAVDNRVYDMANDPNVGRDRALSVEGYTFAAKQLAPKFGALVAAIKGEPAPVPAVAPNVVPLAPGTGGASPPPPVPKGKFDMRNLDQNVDAYLAGRQVRV